MEKHKGKKRNYLDIIGDFFQEVKKVVWPTPRQTFKNTGITLVMIFLVVTFVWVIDIGFERLLRLVMSISK